MLADGEEGKVEDRREEQRALLKFSGPEVFLEAVCPVMATNDDKEVREGDGKRQEEGGRKEEKER